MVSVMHVTLGSGNLMRNFGGFHALGRTGLMHLFKLGYGCEVCASIPVTLLPLRDNVLPFVIPGKAVLVDPIEPTLKAPGTKRLKLKYDKSLPFLLYFCFRSRPPYVRISTKLFYERKFNSGFLS